MRRLALTLLCALAVAPIAVADVSSPTAVKPKLGIFGDELRFEDQTGQQSTIVHSIVGWGQGQTWGAKLSRILEGMGEIPMLGFGTNAFGKEQITPAQIAAGKGDSYLIAINAAIAERQGPIYIRPMGEMNGHWNPYCAFTKQGRAKPGHSTGEFKKAFARIYLIVHGGPAVVVDAKLRKLGLPPLAGADLPLNPAPLVKVVWNPQGYGAPDIPGNSAQAYYPGDKYVDVVGDDLYDIRGKAEWAAAEALYKAHPRKPFSFPEWGLWGLDDPDFVLKMAQFVKTHRRVEFIAYFASKPGSEFDLADKPKSRAAYRKAITPLG